jgi:hypothetical protein
MLTLLWTALTTIVFFIIYYKFKEPYYVCPATFLAKIYSNSLMAIFNSRIRVYKGREWYAEEAANVHISLVPRFDNGSGGNSNRVGSRLTGVHVQEEVWIHSDIGERSEPVSLQCCGAKRRNPTFH